MGSESPVEPKEEKVDEEMEAGDAAAANEGGSDGSASPELGKAPFSDGEKVLAFHGPLIYEAKIQKSESLTGQWKFFVHYLGWNKNWDEWMGSDRLLKYTEENVKQQQELMKIPVVQEKSTKSGRSSQKAPKNPTDVKTEKDEAKNQGSKGKKRKNVPTNEEKEKEKEKKPNELPLMLQFPVTLKKQLIDDSDSITQLGKLVKLPRNPNIDEILKKYLEYRTKKDETITESISEILKGLRCYFDMALPLMLLYNKERPQYKEFVKDNVSPCTIYGAEHLLRLFVKLPELLSYVNMEQDALIKLQQKLLDFLKFMQKNQSAFFLSSYDDNSKDVKAE